MTDWTKELEAAADARCEAAEKGPWIADARVGCSAVYSGPDRNCLETNEPFIAYEQGKWVKTNEYDGAGHWTTDPRHVANHDFIAHARTDLPAAIRNGERLRQELIGVWEHEDDCPSKVTNYPLPVEKPPEDCTCGLREALYGPTV